MRMKLGGLILLSLTALMAGLPKKHVAHRTVHRHNKHHHKGNKEAFVKLKNSAVKRAIYKLMLQNLTENDYTIKPDDVGNEKLGSNRRNENSVKSTYSKGEKSGEQYKSGDKVQRFQDAKGKFADVASMERSQEMASKAKEKKSEETRSNSEKKEEEKRENKKKGDNKGALENDDKKTEKQIKFLKNKETSAGKDRAKSSHENEEKISKAGSTNHGKRIHKGRLSDYELSEQTSKISNKEKDKEMKPKEINDEDKRKNEDASKENALKDSNAIKSMDEEAKIKGKEETNGNIYKSNITENSEVKNQKQESSQQYIRTENKDSSKVQNEKSKSKERDSSEGENFDDDKKGEKDKEMNNERKNATTNRENENVGILEKGNQKKAKEEEKLEKENHKMRSTGDKMMRENEQVSSFIDSSKLKGNSSTRVMESKNKPNDLHFKSIENEKDTDLNFEKVARTKGFQNSTPNTSKEVNYDNSKDMGKESSYFYDVERNGTADQNKTNGKLTGKEDSNRTREQVSENSKNRNENKTETEKTDKNQMMKGDWSIKAEGEHNKPHENKIKEADSGNKNDQPRKIELGGKENMTKMRNEKEKEVNALSSDADKSKETKINQSALEKDKKFNKKEPKMSEDVSDGKHNKKEAMKEGNMLKITEINERQIEGEKMPENSKQVNDNIKEKTEYKGSKSQQKEINEEDGKYQIRQERNK